MLPPNPLTLARQKALAQATASFFAVANNKDVLIYVKTNAMLSVIECAEELDSANWVHVAAETLDSPGNAATLRKMIGNHSTYLEGLGTEGSDNPELKNMFKKNPKLKEELKNKIDQLMLSIQDRLFKQNADKATAFMLEISVVSKAQLGKKGPVIPDDPEDSPPLLPITPLEIIKGGLESQKHLKHDFLRHDNSVSSNVIRFWDASELDGSNFRSGLIDVFLKASSDVAQKMSFPLKDGAIDTTLLNEKQMGALLDGMEAVFEYMLKRDITGVLSPAGIELLQEIDKVIRDNRLINASATTVFFLRGLVNMLGDVVEVGGDQGSSKKQHASNENYPS